MTRRASASDPDDLVAAIGPCLGPCCGEVGDEVLDAFREAGHDAERLARWFAPGRQVACTSISWRRMRDQLDGAGLIRPNDPRRAAVHEDARRRASLVSRAAGERAGRMVAAITRANADASRGLARIVSARFSCSSASSMPRFDSRSASLLNSRRTCSNFTSSSSRDEQPGADVQRLQPRVLHLVLAAHLLDEQLRVGADVHAALRRDRRPTAAPRAGRCIRRRCWSRCRAPPCSSSSDGAVGALRCGRRSRPGPDCRGRPRRCRRRSSSDQEGCGRAAGRRGGHEVEDPRAAVALVQAVVAPHFVEHLRPQTDVADGAEAVARFGDRDALAAVRDAFEQRQRLARELGRRPRRARRSAASSSCSSSRARRRAPSVRFGDLRPARPSAAASAAFSSAANVSACSMCSRSVSSCDAHVLLGDGHLLLHRLVFLVRLDLHQLSFVLRQAALDRGELFLDFAPGGLTGGDALLDGRDAAARCSATRASSACCAAGSSAIRAPRAIGGEVEVLKLDEMLEIRVHCKGDDPVHSTRQPYPLASGHLRTPSRPGLP